MQWCWRGRSRCYVVLLRPEEGRTFSQLEWNGSRLCFRCAAAVPSVVVRYGNLYVVGWSSFLCFSCNLSCFVLFLLHSDPTRHTSAITLDYIVLKLVVEKQKPRVGHAMMSQERLQWRNHVVCVDFESWILLNSGFWLFIICAMCNPVNLDTLTICALLCAPQ